MEEQEQDNLTVDWRSEISGEASPTLKIQDGEHAIFTFADEGTKRTHPDFGTSIVFKVVKGDEEFSWYVNSNNFDLLGQIKELGDVTNKEVKVTRTGSKKSDTRYKIELVTEQ